MPAQSGRDRKTEITALIFDIDGKISSTTRIDDKGFY
jgi:hypothetical protein